MTSASDCSSGVVVELLVWVAWGPSSRAFFSEEILVGWG